MNRLQFATLLSWAGEEGLQGRKRLQKVVFALQQIGCPLDCHFILHHYGPYSRDVADICDEMVAAGLIDESGPEIGARSYSYKLKPQTTDLLKQTPVDNELTSFKDRTVNLFQEDLWNLELGSTVLYFRRQDENEDWNDAMLKACDFKKVEVDAKRSQDALKFAKELVASPARI